MRLYNIMIMRLIVLLILSKLNSMNYKKNNLVYVLITLQQILCNRF